MLAPRRRIYAGLAATLVVAAALAAALALPDEGVAGETLLETLTVQSGINRPPDQLMPTTTTTLQAGQSYKLVVSGTFVVDGFPSDYSHDAIYCFGATGTNPQPPCNPAEQFGEKLFVGYEGGSANGFPAGVASGGTPAYSPSHVYTVMFTASRTARLRFFISNPDGNAATGSLSVQLSSVTADTPPAAPPATPPTGCASQADPCLAPTLEPYLFKVRRPQASRSRARWGDALVTFNLAAGDYADAPSPLIAPRQNGAIVDILGVGNHDLGMVVDSRFRNYARLSCVAAANAHAQKLIQASLPFYSNASVDQVSAGNLDAIRLGAAGVLEFCLELVDRMLARQAGVRASSAGARVAAGGCAPARVSIAITRAGTKTSAGIRRAKVPANLRITCRKIPGGQRLTIRPRKRGARLRSVVGKRLRVGLMRSTAAKTGNRDMTVRFSR